MLKLLLAFLMVGFASLPHAFGLDLKVKAGGKTKTVTQQQLKKLKVHTVTVTDPNESTPKHPAQIAFSAYDGREVLDLAFGSRKAWTKTKNLKFECADGYQPVLETKNFEDGGFYFAFARPGAKEFSIVNNLKDAKKAALAPFYVVWTKDTMQTKEKGFFWPYQVVAVGEE